MCTPGDEGGEPLDAEIDAAPEDVIRRLQQAMNRHDLDAFLACFDLGYQSEQPAHPNRGFGGRDQVGKNWKALFRGAPDFHADLLALTTEDDMVWTEWHWTGSRAEEAPLDMRGVTLFRIANGRIVSGRLYMEETEQGGANIDETVRRLAEGSR